MRTCTHLNQIHDVKPSANGCTKHFGATHHMLVRSLEPSEDWKWCYVDQSIFE